MGLLDMFAGAPPSYMEGLLGQQATEDLRKQSIGTGIANALVGYLAAPKNQNLGLGRILGNSLMAGQQGARGVYENATQDYLMQQKIAEAKRKQEQEQAMQGMISGITDPNERLLANIDREAYVKSKLTPKERKYEKVGNQLVDVSGEAPQVAFTGQSEAPQTNLAKLQSELDAMPANDPRRTTWQNMIKKETSFSPPQTIVMSPRQIFQDEQALRKEYSAIPEVKVFGEVQNAYDTIKTSLGKQSPAGDLAGATKFMKLLDPGSVVRESELGMAMAATGAIDRAQNYYNMLKTGQKLSPAQRKDFLDLSTQLYGAAEGRKTSYDQQYGSIAKQNQLNPSNVVKGFGATPPSSAAGGWSIKEKK